MDIPQIVGSLMAFLGPTLPLWQKAGEGAVEEVGKVGVEKVGVMIGKIRGWFQRGNNATAEQTLDLYIANPGVFASALSTFLHQTLQQHPEWATELQALLADRSVQEIIATNQAIVEDIVMQNSGNGKQRITADDSMVKNVKMSQ